MAISKRLLEYSISLFKNCIQFGTQYGAMASNLFNEFIKYENITTTKCTVLQLAASLPGLFSSYASTYARGTEVAADANIIVLDGYSVENSGVGWLGYPSDTKEGAQLSS